MELGTKPHFPPVQPLADWAAYKLGVAPDRDHQVGFLIARKISRKGTKGAFMFRQAFEAGERTVNRVFARHVEQAARGLGGAR